MLLSRSIRCLRKLSVTIRYHKLGGRKLSTVAEQLDEWKLKFEAENIPEPEASIKNLMAFVLDTRSFDDVNEKQNFSLSTDQLTKLQSLCLARLSRMPVQYLVREWDFRNLSLQMIPPVFIPRPETEELVDHVLTDLNKHMTKDLEILEIGCGSGAICLSLLQELPNASCTALDQSKLACGLTKVNANKLQLLDRLIVVEYKVESGKLNIVEEGKKFDLIISNPPYVPTKELRQVQDEIKL